MKSICLKQKRETDEGNYKGPTVEEVEIQTLFTPFFFWSFE